MKLNTHKLLQNYHKHPNYPTIAKFAGQLAGSHTSDQILEAVECEFGVFQGLPGMRLKPQPLKVFGKLGEQIPQNAYDQIRIALSIPPATRGALLPDAHHGYSVPIGAVVELENAISPAFIGYDISCMMMLSIFTISEDEFDRAKPHYAECLLKETSFGVGAVFENPKEHAVMDNPAWNEIRILKRLKPTAQLQLGSSGGGNHFADLVLGEVLMEKDWLPLKTGEKFIALMTHSGSRGTGHKVATHYEKLANDLTKFVAEQIPKGYGWLEMDTEAGQEYWQAMQLMGKYALANHELIHTDFARRAGLERALNVWNRHNFAWEAKGKYIHRKGATPAENDCVGIIPGSSGTNSYLVSGLGNQHSLMSSSHGAGRPYSRTEAIKRHNQTTFSTWMDNHDIVSFGVAKDETFLAYKDIEDIISAQAGELIEPVARMFPRVVIMGGTADDGD